MLQGCLLLKEGVKPSDAQGYKACWEDGVSHLLARMYLLAVQDHWHFGTMTATSQHSAQTPSHLVSKYFLYNDSRGDSSVCLSLHSAEDVIMPHACKNLLFGVRYSIRGSRMLCGSPVMIAGERGDSCASPWVEQETRSWLPQPAGRLHAPH